MATQAELKGTVARRRLRSAAARSAIAIRAQLWQVRIDLVILAGLAVVALVVRLVMLEDIPPGLHGDEGWTGIDARRVLDEGWIGPYVGSALGQPAGFLYLAAPFVKLFGDTVFAIRLLSALTGTATVLVTYVTFRVMFDRQTGAIAAFLLAVTVWHLHFSRIAFTVISWPLLEMLALLFLFLGLKSGRWFWYGLAGLSLGLGVYTYSAFPVFIIALAVVIGWLVLGVGLARIRGLWSNRELLLFAGRIALMASIAIVAALPLIRYATDDKNDYFNHHRLVSLFEQPEWESGSVSDRAELLWDGTEGYFTAAFWSGEEDEADGTGHQALVDRVSLALIVTGAAILLWRWRHPSSAAVLIMVAVLPVGAIVTTNAEIRRTLGIVPFLAVLSAVPLAFWWRQSAKLALPLRAASYAGIVAVVGLVAYLNLSYYFDEYPDTRIAWVTFGQELTDASLFIRDLPDDTIVYYYSVRWDYDYETRRYLAPDHDGRDRSIEDYRNLDDLERIDLTVKDAADIAYVFLSPYLEQPEMVAKLYPGGTVVEGGDSFRAYLLPRSLAPDLPPTPTPVPPMPTPTPSPTSTPRPTPIAGTIDRDVTRVQDLTAAQAGLEEIFAEGGSYPNTGGTIQTLCVLPEFDKGCELEDVMAAIPSDPLGEPSVNGYWYVSDGSSYTLYARREAERLPDCTDHPDFLSHVPSLICFSAP